jgi:hypothetical protein
VQIVSLVAQKPTALTWDNNNNVIIAEKAGMIKISNSWVNAAPAVLLDIQNEVASYGDHGLTSVLYNNGYLWATYMKENPQYGDNCQDWGQWDGRTASQVRICLQRNEPNVSWMQTLSGRVEAGPDACKPTL